MSEQPSPTGVLQRVVEHARHRPDSPALSSTDGQLTLTYRQLVQVVEQEADRLDSLTPGGTLHPGDRVLVVSDSSAASYVRILACMWAGAVPAVADHCLPQATLDAYADTIGPRIVLRATGDDVAAISDNDTATGDPMNPPRGDLQAPPFQPEVPQAMLFTSGTTGAPKAVVLPARSFLAIPDTLRAHNVDWITWRPEEVTYTPLPASHIGGLWWVLNGLASGCHTVTGPAATAGATGANGHEDLLATLHRWSVATVCMVPTLLGRVAASLRTATAGNPPRCPSSLRLIVFGGSRAVREDVAAVEASGVRTAQIYGLSETGCTALCLPTSADMAGSGSSSLELIDSACVGTPYPGVQLCVLADPLAKPAPLPEACPLPTDPSPLHPGSDREGTLWIRTPARMLGYFGRPQQTADVLHEGWLNTGDRVEVRTVHPDGPVLVYLRGRVSELIICGGANVNPDDVDAIARSVPGVADAGAFSIPDATFGALVGLAVVPADPNLDERQQRRLQRSIAAAFRDRAGAEARPARIVITGALSRTASGKIRRHELTRRFTEPQTFPTANPDEPRAAAVGTQEDP
ncbi:Putative fatty-acid--CoA ligase FadD10 [Corynebacterium heidelbergense]|nr:AMP-binding protein [Corynebacterium heidelbergense]WCZ35655.1 Putative fatty-acid--CoA ligase FadD10 [Corynebacterium heidelbergense]